MTPTPLLIAQYVIIATTALGFIAGTILMWMVVEGDHQKLRRKIKTKNKLIRDLHYDLRNKEQELIGYKQVFGNLEETLAEQEASQ